MSQISVLIRIPIPITISLMRAGSRLSSAIHALGAFVKAAREPGHTWADRASPGRSTTKKKKTLSLQSIELLIFRKINQRLKLQTRLVFCGGGSTGNIGAAVPGGRGFSQPVPGEGQESWVKAVIAKWRHLNHTILFCRTMKVTEVLTQGPDPGSGVSQHHWDVSDDTVQSVNISYCPLQSFWWLHVTITTQMCKPAVGAAEYSFYNKLM